MKLRLCAALIQQGSLQTAQAYCRHFLALSHG